MLNPYPPTARSAVACRPTNGIRAALLPAGVGDRCSERNTLDPDRPERSVSAASWADPLRSPQRQVTRTAPSGFGPRAVAPRATGRGQRRAELAATPSCCPVRNGARVEVDLTYRRTRGRTSGGRAAGRRAAPVRASQIRLGQDGNAAASSAIRSGPTRQQPPTSVAPAATQVRAVGASTAGPGRPIHRRASGSQASPLFG
jgi:hypothetical protein